MFWWLAFLMAPRKPASKALAEVVPVVIDEPQLQVLPVASDDRPTVVEKCRLKGKCFEEQVTVRSEASYVIEACNEDGVQRPVGGDPFFVYIRGPSMIRARVTDNNDGTYLVQWKPSTSGTYTVAVSLLGVNLPGSPATVHVTTTKPCPMKTVVRGEHLHHAVSRQQHNFDVLFKDKLGKVAHAVDLDVFVEPLPPNSPRFRLHETLVAAKEAAAAAVVATPAPKAKKTKATGATKGKDAQLKAQQEREKEEAEQAEKELEEKLVRERNANKRNKRPSKEFPPMPALLNLEKLSSGGGGTPRRECSAQREADRQGSSRTGTARSARPDRRPEKQVTVRHRMMRVKVGDKPLLVRAEAHKGSEEVGRLLPGQVVTIIEEQIDEDGEVRACISLDSIGDAVDDAAASYRSEVPDAHYDDALGTLTTTPNPSHRGVGTVRPLAPRIGMGMLSSAAASLGLGGKLLGAADPALGAKDPALTAPTVAIRSSDGANAAPESAVVSAGVSAGVPTAAVFVDASDTARSREAASEEGADFRRGSSSNRSRPSNQNASFVPVSGAAVGVPSGAKARAPSAALPSAARTTGWVTLVKNGQKLVSSRVQLGPGSRRQYMQQWARRKANDRAMSAPVGADGRPTEAPAVFKNMPTRNEIEADPSGIAFAFGGVEPGTLHARGQLLEVHKAAYSVGRAGQYLLHVRMRQAACSLPGSPFVLTVVPAGAYAKSSNLPSHPLSGMVGTAEKDGCECELKTSDKMGNPCILGGAKVEILIVEKAGDPNGRTKPSKPAKGGSDLAVGSTEAREKAINTVVVDRGDGTYTLRWTSKFSGTFRTRVVIDGEDVVGSPTIFKLISSTPDLTKTVLTGEGLKSAMAGRPSTVQIAFVDQFLNTASPNSKFQFGIALVPRHGGERDKVAKVPEHKFQGSWTGGATGIFELQYVPTQAGQADLHVWCIPEGKGERLALPGSPFHLHIAEGPASAVASVVEGWTKVMKDDKNEKFAKDKNADLSVLYTSDTISIRPLIYDEFGNGAALPEDALVIVHDLPSGVKHPLGFTQTTKGGLTTYDIRHDLTNAGEHAVHILLHGKPIRGSPVTFSVQPSKPDPGFCKILSPDDTTFWTNRSYCFTLKTYDRFGNECKLGGLAISNRLALVKQNARDQTSLVPSNHKLSWDDNQDGTYAILVILNIPCTVRLIVNVDKNMQAGMGELPAVSLAFLDSNTATEENNPEKKLTPAAKKASLTRSNTKTLSTSAVTGESATGSIGSEVTDENEERPSPQQGSPTGSPSAQRRTIASSNGTSEKRQGEVALAEDVPSFNNWLAGLVDGSETIADRPPSPPPFTSSTGSTRKLVQEANITPRNTAELEQWRRKQALQAK